MFGDFEAHSFTITVRTSGLFGDRETDRAPARGKELVMIEQPHFDSYSIRARICFGIAVSGAAFLVAMAITSIYFV